MFFVCWVIQNRSWHCDYVTDSALIKLFPTLWHSLVFRQLCKTGKTGCRRYLLLVNSTALQYNANNLLSKHNNSSIHQKKIFEVVTKINMFTPWEEFLCNVHAVSSRPVTIIASTSFSSIALCMSPILSCQLRPTTRRKELNYRYTNFIHNFYKPSYCYRPLSGAVASFTYLIRYKSSLYWRKMPNYVTAWLTEHPSNNDCSVGIAVVRE